MTRKSTLRTHAYPLQRFFPGLSIPFCNLLRRLENPLFQYLHPLHRGELARDQSQHDVFVPGQRSERLEPSCARSVVFEIVCVDVEILEEFGRDNVISAFGEMSPVDEIAAAEMDAHVHVCGAMAQTIVVELDV